MIFCWSYRRSSLVQSVSACSASVPWLQMAFKQSKAGLFMLGYHVYGELATLGIPPSCTALIWVSCQDWLPQLAVNDMQNTDNRQIRWEVMSRHLRSPLGWTLANGHWRSLINFYNLSIDWAQVEPERPSGFSEKPFSYGASVVWDMLFFPQK